MDRYVEQFFKAEKPRPGDGDKFLASLHGRLTYYRHYKIIARQLEAERRRGRYLTLGFLGVSLLAIVLVLALFRLPVVLAAGEFLSSLLGVDNPCVILMCTLLGLTFSLAGCRFAKLKCN